MIHDSWGAVEFKEKLWSMEACGRQITLVVRGTWETYKWKFSVDAYAQDGMRTNAKFVPTGQSQVLPARGKGRPDTNLFKYGKRSENIN
ncbi:hypothetical protein M514_00081 [Trichuris suis]|uniref:Uncharacterized protein n=1 Tax=Trichuris suis TaxID=68888 RepID=A0A085MNX2_9BILA|nr:hypothetical protein M513_00081 [Trichuris suis]KFD72946.1 hypothetical protein M514_00081 [Trichuris suis]